MTARLLTIALPKMEVQSVLWLRPRTGDRVALLWEDKPSAVANNAHSRCRLSIAQASLALRSAQAFFDRLLQDERRKVRVSLIDREVIIPLSLIIAKGVSLMQGI